MPSQNESKQTSVPLDLDCPKCGSMRVRRIERKGILEIRLFKLFGYFPWRCATCRHKFFLKLRGREGDRPKEIAD